MERYLLFMDNEYYPLGGWDDFQGGFATIEEAKNYKASEPKDNGHIIKVTVSKGAIEFNPVEAFFNGGPWEPVETDD
ncbi:hypothetical protein [Okeania sp. SIO1H2]|uniref:hypothetical protein n=1 Tax=Okeania sp. SIO1H2 TaxID=2607775 RepID=UPI00141CFE29|nr:hypothetical protein [Okeania sp. SIO1H2]NET97629.1 hypothetical protein [Okeania sp. SIO1H2]